MYRDVSLVQVPAPALYCDWQWPPLLAQWPSLLVCSCCRLHAIVGRFTPIVGSLASRLLYSSTVVDSRMKVLKEDAGNCLFLPKQDMRVLAGHPKMKLMGTACLPHPQWQRVTVLPR